MPANRGYIGTEGPLRLPFYGWTQALRTPNRTPARRLMSCTTSDAVNTVEMRDRSTATRRMCCLCDATTHQRAWPVLSSTSKQRVPEPLALFVYSSLSTVRIIALAPLQRLTSWRHTSFNLHLTHLPNDLQRMMAGSHRRRYVDFSLECDACARSASLCLGATVLYSSKVHS